VGWDEERKKKKKQKMSDETIREEILEHMNEIEVSFFLFRTEGSVPHFFLL